MENSRNYEKIISSFGKVKTLKITIGWYLGEIVIDKNTDLLLGNGFTLEILKSTKYNQYYTYQEILKRIKENYWKKYGYEFVINDSIIKWEKWYLQVKILFNNNFDFFTDSQIEYHKSEILKMEQKIIDIYSIEDWNTNFENWFCYLDMALYLLNKMIVPSEFKKYDKGAGNITIYAFHCYDNPNNSPDKINATIKNEINDWIKKIKREIVNLKKIIISSLSLNYELTYKDLHNLNYLQRILNKVNNIFTLNYDSFTEKIVDKKVIHLHGSLNDPDNAKMGWIKGGVYESINQFSILKENSSKRLVIIGVNFEPIELQYDTKYLIDAMEEYEEIYIAGWDSSDYYEEVVNWLNNNGIDLNKNLNQTVNVPEGSTDWIIKSKHKRQRFMLDATFKSVLKYKILVKFDVKKLYQKYDNRNIETL